MTRVVENGFLDHLGHVSDGSDVPGLSDWIFQTTDLARVVGENGHFMLFLRYL